MVVTLHYIRHRWPSYPQQFYSEYSREIKVGVSLKWTVIPPCLDSSLHIHLSIKATYLLSYITACATPLALARCRSSPAPRRSVCSGNELTSRHADAFPLFLFENKYRPILIPRHMLLTALSSQTLGNVHHYTSHSQSYSIRSLTVLNKFLIIYKCSLWRSFKFQFCLFNT